MSPQQKCIIRTVEDTLSQCGQFTLEGLKKLLELNHVIEVGVVDVTESPIERQKKQKTVLTAYLQISNNG